MLRPHLLFAVVLVNIQSGCGQGQPAQVTKPAPGGGMMFPLPNDRGYFDVKTEIEAPSRGARGKSRTSRIVASFYQADGTTPMNPAPTDVNVKLGTDEINTTVVLSPSMGDPKTKPSVQFVSPPGDFPEGPRGKMIATINGEAVQVPFVAR